VEDDEKQKETHSDACHDNISTPETNIHSSQVILKISESELPIPTQIINSENKVNDLDSFEEKVSSVDNGEKIMENSSGGVDSHSNRATYTHIDHMDDKQKNARIQENNMTTPIHVPLES